MNSELLIVIISLFLSAFFSGGETAYTVAGRLSMEVFRRKGRKGAKIAARLSSSPDLFFSTTLVGTNVSNVLYSTFTALYLDHLGVPIQVIIVISPLFLLIFGEILPKSIAREHPERIALLSSSTLWLSFILLFPIVTVARFASNLLLRLTGNPNVGNSNHKISMSDIRSVWGDLRRSGTVKAFEADLLDRVLTFRRRKVSEIMTPRAQILSLSIDTPIENAQHVARSSGYGRIPIYRDSIDNMVGFIMAKDMLGNPESLEKAMQPVYYAPEQQRTGKLFKELRKRKENLAVVVDEFGGTAGLVTIEDLVEELFGEIQDEHDFSSSWGKKISEGVYLFSGRTEVEFINDFYHVKLPKGEYDTVGGLMNRHFSRIPEAGETIVYPDCVLRVVAGDKRRVKRVLLRLIPKKPKKV